MPTASHSDNPAQIAREKARVLERVGRYREAAHYWHLALADAPNDAEVLCNLAHNYYLLNERWRAGQYLDQALAAEPNNERVHRLNCILVLGQGKKAAIASALRAVELDPSGRDAWYLLAQSYLEAGALEKAREAAVHLRELAPQWATAHETVGEVASRLGKWEAAEKEARAALALDPESGEAHTLLGVYFVQKRDYVEAARAFIRAMELEPHDRRVRQLLIFTITRARKQRLLFLYSVPLFLALSLIWLPALHFSGWQSCLIGFVPVQVLALIKALRDRVGLPPDVWRAVRVARRQERASFFRRIRYFLNKIEY